MYYGIYQIRQKNYKGQGVVESNDHPYSEGKRHIEEESR